MNDHTNQTTDMKLDVRVYPVENPKNSLIAFASVTINDVFAVQGIKVVNSEKGLFVSMPNKVDRDGEYRDVCFPVTKEFREQLNNTILDTFAKTQLKEKSQEKTSVTEKLQEKKTSTEKPAVAKGQKAKKVEPEH